MTGVSDPGARPPDALLGRGLGVALFLGLYPLLVLTLRFGSIRVARRVAAPNFDRRVRRFNLTMFLARMAIPAWLGVGVFVLGWGGTVRALVEGSGIGRFDTFRLPGILLGTLPSMVAWMGLWWAQFPTERALREQSLLADLDAELPLHAPPSFRGYFISNLRLQLLFTIVPILLMVVVRDAVRVAALEVLPTAARHWIDPRGADAAENRPDAINSTGASTGPRDAAADERSTMDRSSDDKAADEEIDQADMILWVISAGLVFMIAPEVLRRVLQTSPLPDSPLRRRLEALCRRSGMRYRDILLWHTQFNMGNAAVMGVLPPVRYILLSDVLLETMTDDQIEAVFAHEVGHVVHRHMIWFVVFFAVLFLSAMGLEDKVRDLHLLGPMAMSIVSLVACSIAFVVGFGFLSRRFERQADVFAARTIQRERGAAEASEHAGGAVAAAVAAADAAGSDFLVQMRAAASMVNAGPAAVAAAGASVAPSQREAIDESSYVGHYGATLFGSALHRVARVNNIPISKHEWLHGSIASRMKHLRDMSADPELTGRFDRLMIKVYCGLLFALTASIAWLMLR